MVKKIIIGVQKDMRFRCKKSNNFCALKKDPLGPFFIGSQKTQSLNNDNLKYISDRKRFINGGGCPVS